MLILFIDEKERCRMEGREGRREGEGNFEKHF